MNELFNQPFRGAGGMIFINGFMGTGKSYQAKKLSAAFNLPFYDLDKLVEEEMQMSIAEAFAQKGEAWFRKAESEVLKKLDANKPAIIACGGGTPCFYDNMQWMNEHGITIYLKADEERIFERLKRSKIKRPLIAEMSDLELKHFINTKIAEREYFYKQCQWIMAEEDINTDWFNHNILNKNG